MILRPAVCEQVDQSLTCMHQEVSQPWIPFGGAKVAILVTLVDPSK